MRQSLIHNVNHRTKDMRQGRGEGRRGGVKEGGRGEGGRERVKEGGGGG